MIFEAIYLTLSEIFDISGQIAYGNNKGIYSLSFPSISICFTLTATYMQYHFLSGCRPEYPCSIYSPVSSLAVPLRLRGHFVIEEIQKLVYLVKAQGLLSLLQVPHKPQTYTGLHGKILLCHIELLAQRFYRCRQIVHALVYISSGTNIGFFQNLYYIGYKMMAQ